MSAATVPLEPPGAAPPAAVPFPPAAEAFPPAAPPPGAEALADFPPVAPAAEELELELLLPPAAPPSRPPSRLLGDGVPVDDDALQPLVEDLQLGDNRVGNLEPLRLVRGRCGDGLVPSCPSTRRFAWERILQLYINVDYMMNMCFNMHIGLISSSRVG